MYSDDNLNLDNKRNVIAKEKLLKIYDSIDNKTKLLENAIISGETVDFIEMTTKYIKNKVLQAVKPYIRGSFIHYIQTRDCYSVRIPCALLRDGETPPQTRKTEKELWIAVYEYLFGKSSIPTIAELFNEWREIRKNDKAIKQRGDKNYLYKWNKYIKDDAIANMEITKVTAKHLISFYKKIVDGNEEFGRAIDRKELTKIKTIFNAIFDLAIEKELIQTNTARNVDTRNLKCKIVRNDEKVYTEEERITLLEYLLTGTKDNCYSLGAALMFCLGIRIGELKALKWDYVDYENFSIYIGNQVTYQHDRNGNGKHVEFNYTKGGENADRYIPLCKTALYILERVKSLNGNQEYLFLNQDGNFFSTNKFNDHLKKYCAACNVPYLSSHKIRFAAITEISKSGIDLGTLQRIAGHLDKRTTEHYIRNRDYAKKFDTIRNCLDLSEETLKNIEAHTLHTLSNELPEQ